MTDKPWHPCDDCLGALAAAHERFAKFLPRELTEYIEPELRTSAAALGALRETYGNELVESFTRSDAHQADVEPSSIGAAFREWLQGEGIELPVLFIVYRSSDLEKLHRKLRVNECERWLEFHVSGDVARTFRQYIERPLASLCKWENCLREAGYYRWSEVRRRAQKCPQVEGFMHGMRSEYDDIMDSMIESADYLRQLSAMTRGKLERVDRSALAAGEAEPGRPLRPCSLIRKGTFWDITYEGRTIHLPDIKGTRYLAYLLESPNKQIRALGLYQLITYSGTRESVKEDFWFAEHPTEQADESQNGWQQEKGKKKSQRVEGVRVDQMEDDDSMEQYRDCLHGLRDDLRKARKDNDEAAQLRIQTEIDGIKKHMSSSTFTGRSKAFSDDDDRARQNVTKALDRVMAHIRDSHELLGRHLDSSIQRGFDLVYAPSSPTEWEIKKM